MPGPSSRSTGCGSVTSKHPSWIGGDAPTRLFTAKHAGRDQVGLASA
jgi:hypothetical protein